MPTNLILHLKTLSQKFKLKGKIVCEKEHFKDFVNVITETHPSSWPQLLLQYLLYPSVLESSIKLFVTFYPVKFKDSCHQILFVPLSSFICYKIGLVLEFDIFTKNKCDYKYLCMYTHKIIFFKTLFPYFNQIYTFEKKIWKMLFVDVSLPERYSNPQTMYINMFWWTCS